MKFIKSLSEVEQMQLADTYNNHPLHRVRQRAHAVLLSSKGYSVRQLIEILGVGRDAIDAWLNAWSLLGIAGLQDRERSGRPRIFTSDDHKKLNALLDENPHQLKTAIALFEEATGKAACLDTYRKTVKKI